MYLVNVIRYGPRFVPSLRPTLYLSPFLFFISCSAGVRVSEMKVGDTRQQLREFVAVVMFCLATTLSIPHCYTVSLKG